MVMQYGVSTAPALIFFVAGLYRYHQIKDTATGAVRYSISFKTKVGLSILMGFAVLSFIITDFVLNTDSVRSSLMNQCGLDYFSLIYVIDAIAWFAGSALIVFEYKRLHSEAWYANKMFWVLNLIVIMLTVGFLWKDYMMNPYMLYSAVANFVVNLILVVFMFNTQKRNAFNKRPTFEEHLLNTPKQDTRRTGLNSACFILIRFQEKFHTMGGLKYFQFRVELNSEKFENVKLSKTGQEFLKLEQIIRS